MYFTTLTTLLTLAASALAAPAPAPTYHNWPGAPTKTYTAPRITHTVVAGRGGQLRFDPENVVAEVGSIVEFHFLPANHSVVEAAFNAPCRPRSDVDPAAPNSFFSGFFPVTPNPDGSLRQSEEVFQIEVKDDKPIWYYCGQPGGGGHCQRGMVGVINQRFDTPFTLEKFRQEAAKVPPPPGLPAGGVRGGWRIPNPNPLGGF